MPCSHPHPRPPLIHLPRLFFALSLPSLWRGLTPPRARPAADALTPLPRAARRVELSPYVVTRKGDASSTTADIPESEPVDGSYLRYRWYRSLSHRKASVCSVHPGEPAVMQNVHSKSYHCGEECFAQSWREWMRNRIAHGGAHRRGVGFSVLGV